MDQKLVKNDAPTFLTKPNILLVEDNLILKKIAWATLEDLGCCVSWTGTGSGALEALKKGYDLVLLDIGLPDTTGITVAQKLRETERRAGKSPAILIAFTTSFELEDACFAAGMNDFCKKPASREELRALLEKWLGKFGGELAHCNSVSQAEPRFG